MTDTANTDQNKAHSAPATLATSTDDAVEDCCTHRERPWKAACHRAVFRPLGGATGTLIRMGCEDWRSRRSTRRAASIKSMGGATRWSWSAIDAGDLPPRKAKNAAQRLVLAGAGRDRRHRARGSPRSPLCRDRK